jgi:hypothetical protein
MAECCARLVDLPGTNKRVLQIGLRNAPTPGPVAFGQFQDAAEIVAKAPS